MQFGRLDSWKRASCTLIILAYVAILWYIMYLDIYTVCPNTSNVFIHYIMSFSCCSTYECLILFLIFRYMLTYTYMYFLHFFCILCAVYTLPSTTNVCTVEDSCLQAVYSRNKVWSFWGFGLSERKRWICQSVPHAYKVANVFIKHCTNKALLRAGSRETMLTR